MTNDKFPCSSTRRLSITDVGIDMKKLLLNFLLFLAAMWGLEQISLPTVIAGIGLAMALVGVLHIAVTPENY